MKTTILKCDRCKKEVEGLIKFSFVNKNVRLVEDTKEDSNRFRTMTDLPYPTYPTLQGELCLDCIQEISRWLGHPENILSGSIEEVVK